MILGVWLAGLLGYLASRMSQRKGLMPQAAAEIDSKGSLQDEVKSAYWFVTSPQATQRSSEWVELQIRRAARHIGELNIDKLYPRVIPRTSWLACGLIAVLIVLNFAPLPTNHNWMFGQAAPAFSLTAEQQKLIKQTKELLKKAEKLGQPELEKKLEEIVNSLEGGKISPSDAIKQLDDLKNSLDEGNLDAANINEGLDEMAEDLAKSPELEDTSKAMSEHDLSKTADELSKMAQELSKAGNPGDMQSMSDALNQAAENDHPGMQGLAQDMKQAAKSLADQDMKGAQDALNQAAKDAQDLNQRMQSQQAKNDAGQKVQDLQNSLRQQQQPGKGQQPGGQQQAGATKPENGPGQKDAPGGNKDGASDSASSESGDPGAGDDQDAQKSPGEAGQPSDSAKAGKPGAGLNTGNVPQAPMDIMGAPTKLNIKLEKEQEQAQSEGGKQQDIEEASKQERSKLDYRNVHSELTPAQKDVLNQDKIPWEYRSLIKNYFQAIRPPH